jgi:hypothetical protein
MSSRGFSREWRSNGSYKSQPREGRAKRMREILGKRRLQGFPALMTKKQG